MRLRREKESHMYAFLTLRLLTVVLWSESWLLRSWASCQGRRNLSNEVPRPWQGVTEGPEGFTERHCLPLHPQREGFFDDEKWVRLSGQAGVIGFYHEEILSGSYSKY